MYKLLNYLCYRKSVINSRFMSLNLVNNQKKKRICIVGSGPAGFYIAQYILKRLPDSYIDIVERLPVPFGLVRFGVAPDHPEVKNVINTFTKTAENQRFRFFGNQSLGKDFTLAELREKYHAVILTYGADKDNHLNIPNEDAKSVLSARKFVAWYNGLPGAEKLEPNLKCKTATIIGQGNVAIDVARILLTSIDKLKTTDITENSLSVLAESNIEKIYLVGRRGPLQAAFTIKELREMLTLPNIKTIWREKDFIGIPEIVTNVKRPRKRLTELMVKHVQLQAGSNAGKKEFYPIFSRSPKCIGEKNIELIVNKLQGDTAIGTSEIETLQTDLILRSIGYKSTCADPDINFDNNKGYVLNKAGRVLKINDKQSDEELIDTGLYVSGWLATGPTGVILTTMNNSFGVGEAVCQDFVENKINFTEFKPGLSETDGRIVTWSGWKKIDKAEIEEGKIKGKPREKIVDTEKMLEIAGV